MNKVCVITNTFLPDKNGRAERLFARLRYLKKDGWEPIVRIPHESAERKNVSVDEVTLTVYRAQNTDVQPDSRGSETQATQKIKSKLKDLAFPDSYIRYLIPEVKSAIRIIQEENIDVIYTMCFPFSMHLLGYALSRLSDIGWVAEFRDPWVTNPYHFQGSANILHRKAEKLVVNNADSIVYNYGIQIPENYFVNQYGQDIADNIVRLNCPGSCGFDFERYENTEPVCMDRFRITYAGAFHGSEHSPKTFLKGVKKFSDDFGLSSKEVGVDFFGDWRDEFDELVSKLGLDSVVTSHGWISHKRAFAHLKGSDVLLAIIRPYSGDELNVPSKIVDYVAAYSAVVYPGSRRAIGRSVRHRQSTGQYRPSQYHICNFQPEIYKDLPLI